MDKIYILLKDLPNAKAGTIISPRLDKIPKGWYGFIDGRGELVKFAEYDLENMPEWFKLKEDKVWTDSDMIEFGEYFDEPEAVKSSFSTFKRIHTKP